jgi:hypothetical protein
LAVSTEHNYRFWGFHCAFLGSGKQLFCLPQGVRMDQPINSTEVIGCPYGTYVIYKNKFQMD